MFFPFGDTPNPVGYKPWMTRALIALNVAVYFFITSPLSSTIAAQGYPGLPEYIKLLGDLVPGGVTPDILARITQYDVFTFMHGYKPGAPSWVDLFFSLFLHGGGWHLLGNMLFLWIYGNNVEHRIGKFGFLFIYLATGAIATLSFGMLAGDSMTPLVGASGAISGILGLYFVMFPSNKIKVLVMLFPFLVTVWLVPARIVLGIFVVVDNLLPLAVGTSSGVAYGAHLGGFLAGLIVGWFGQRYGWSLRWIWRAFTGKREIIREVPKTERRDPRTIIIDGEIIDDDLKNSN